MKPSEITEGKFDTYIQFENVDIHTPDGLFIKVYTLPSGALAPQHAHKFSHATLVCSGSVRAWRHKSLLGDYSAGQVILIEAEEVHEFLALEDSRIACIHNTDKYEETKLNGFELE